MESATWCRTPAAASAASSLRPEVSKNSSTALSSNEGELARSITACVPAMASLRPWPVMVLTPVLGEAAMTSWPPWRRMGMVFEPIRPVPPITTIFIANLLVRCPQAGVCDGRAASRLVQERDQRLISCDCETYAGILPSVLWTSYRQTLDLLPALPHSTCHDNLPSQLILLLSLFQ